MQFLSLLLLLCASLPLAAASDTPTSLAASFLQGFTKKRGLRAEDLLGVEYDENQDSHPHVKGKEIIGAIKKFHDAMHRQHIAALAAARLGVQQKDEV